MHEMYRQGTAVCDTGVKILGTGKKCYLEKNLYQLNKIKLHKRILPKVIEITVNPISYYWFSELDSGEQQSQGLRNSFPLK